MSGWFFFLFFFDSFKKTNKQKKTLADLVFQRDITYCFVLATGLNYCCSQTAHRQHSLGEIRELTSWFFSLISMYALLKWNVVFAKHNHHGERKSKNARWFHTQHFDPCSSCLTPDTRVSKCQIFFFPSQKDKLSLLPLQHTPCFLSSGWRDKAAEILISPLIVSPSMFCFVISCIFHAICRVGQRQRRRRGGEGRWGGGTDESCWWDNSSFRFSLVNPASGTLPLLLAKEQRQQ